jgi:hypothetical protein
MSLDQCHQQCPYVHASAGICKVSIVILVVYQLMLAPCIAVSWKVGAPGNICVILSFSLRLYQSARVRCCIGGFFDGFSGEGAVGSSCARTLPYEDVASGKAN